MTCHKFSLEEFKAAFFEEKEGWEELVLHGKECPKCSARIEAFYKDPEIQKLVNRELEEESIPEETLKKMDNRFYKMLKDAQKPPYRAVADDEPKMPSSAKDLSPEDQAFLEEVLATSNSYKSAGNTAGTLDYLTQKLHQEWEKAPQQERLLNSLKDLIEQYVRILNINREARDRLLKLLPEGMAREYLKEQLEQKFSE